jgi:hypothetical protein
MRLNDMKRVNIKAILKNKNLRAKLIQGVVDFLCALEGHKHTEKNNADDLQPRTKTV